MHATMRMTKARRSTLAPVIPAIIAMLVVDDVSASGKLLELELLDECDFSLEVGDDSLLGEVDGGNNKEAPSGGGGANMPSGVAV